MTRTQNPTDIARHSDTWIGACLIAAGVTAYTIARSFDAMSRTYPMALAFLLAVFGAMLILRVVVASPKSVSFARPSRVAALALVVLVPWTIALSSGFGFVLPTLLMQLAFGLLCGIRPIGRAALYAVLITAVSYVVFVQGLGVRLPRAIFPWLI